MITRRDFVTATIAAGTVAAGAGMPLHRLAAQGRLTQDQLLRFEPLGNVTLVHFADLHAQLRPVYFREPAGNLGVGEAKGQPPHIVGAEFRKFYGITDRSAQAYALTFDDFAELARTYGRMGGLDRIATVVEAIRSERAQNMLLLDGGDTWTNSWTSLKTKGQDVVDAMRLLRPDAMTGHWEFTLGAERLKEIVAKLPYAFLAQNVREADFEDKVFESSRIFERGGVRVAVIGQALPFTPIANPRWMFPAWTFGIRERALREEVAAVKAKGAQLVVLLSHNGFDLDRKLAGRVEGIDVILTAHTHDALPDVTKVGRTLLVASGSNGKFVSRLDLDVQGKEIKGFRYRLIPIFADAIKPEPRMAALISKSRAPYEQELRRVLGRTSSLLYRRGTFDGTLDNVLCEAMLSQRDAEIALSPGIRWGAAVLPGAEITFEDVTNGTAMTYPACYRMTMTGERLKQILE
ncbi:MAG: thiosulfohydrolase SoxB, partial [Hyphomicrobiaceae bacterium]